jgi:hypothetical protein
MKTEQAGESIAIIVSAMAAYKPEAVVQRGVARCQHCQIERSLLDKPGPFPHTKGCPVTLANTILIALGGAGAVK